MLLSVTEIFGVVYILQYKNSLSEELILCPATRVFLHTQGSRGLKRNKLKLYCMKGVTSTH